MLTAYYVQQLLYFNMKYLSEYRLNMRLLDILLKLRYTDKIYLDRHCEFEGKYKIA